MEADLHGQIPLHYAARNCAAVAVHYIGAFMLRFCPVPASRDRYSSLNTQDKDGRTPLHYSVEQALQLPD